MARRRAARPRNRGWVTASGTMVTTNQTIDNVDVDFDELLEGQDISQQSFIDNEKSDFFLSRVIVNWSCLVDPAALNLSGRLPLDQVILVCASEELETMRTQPPLTNYDTVLQNSARVVRVDSRFVYEYDQDFEGGDNGTSRNILAGMYNHFEWDLSFRGGLNIREGQGLFIGIGQADWTAQPWIESDSVQCDWVARMLFTERRGS